jgi:hypothetical protein
MNFEKWFENEWRDKTKDKLVAIDRPIAKYVWNASQKETIKRVINVMNKLQNRACGQIYEDHAYAIGIEEIKKEFNVD